MSKFNVRHSAKQARTASTPAGTPVRTRKRKSSVFPLFKHSRGLWAKKVCNHTRYFGRIADDPSGKLALNLWLEQKDDLLAGRKPRETRRGMLTISDGFNLYLDHLEAKAKNGELSERWFHDVKRSCELALSKLGRTWNVESLRPDDFGDLVAMLWKRGRNGNKATPVSVQNHVHRIKGAFNWLAEAGHIERQPAYGTAFKAPTRTVVDRHRDTQRARYFDRREVRSLLRATKSSPRMRAAILLATNTGCQNEDIATLEFRHLDLRGGWYVQPRSKKAKKRRAKLWTRTVKAIRIMLSDRPGIGPNDLVFVSETGGQWHGRNCIAKEFADVKKAAGITADRAGFQWLRHSFITEASQTGDQIAVQLACGHAARTITENYIHRVYDPRLEAIAAAVESWLVGSAVKS